MKKKVSKKPVALSRKQWPTKKAPAKKKAPIVEKPKAGPRFLFAFHPFEGSGGVATVEGGSWEEAMKKATEYAERLQTLKWLKLEIRFYPGEGQ